MTLVDVNVLLHAHREEARDHTEYLRWLEAEMERTKGFGASEILLGSFIRIATHPLIFDPPTPLENALGFARMLRDHPNAVRLTPGARHWAIFCELVEAAGCRENLVADACLAALVIEYGCEWISTDRDFARFPGLRWRHPLAES